MLYHKHGLVNNSHNISAQTIECTIDSVHPTTQLNLLGGDNLTITGTQLPWALGKSYVNIKFNDSQSTPCVPQESSSNKLICLTKPFDQTVSAGALVGANIEINNKTVNNWLAMTTMTNTKSGMYLSPSSANPTLKTKINITLEADFPYTLNNRSHLSVNATNITNPDYFRQMNVIGVDDSTKTMTVMFGGAYSGDYQISIRHKEFGLVDASGLILTVGSNVTSYYPM